MSYVAAAAVIATLTSCGSFPPRGCSSTDAPPALKTLLAGDWSALGPQEVAELWPQTIGWGSESAGDVPCSGTATHSYLEYVEANECLCCDHFSFTDRLANNACGRVLTSVHLVRFTRDETEARWAAERLLAQVTRLDKNITEPVTVVTTKLSATEQQVSSVETISTRDGWRVRLLVYRVTLPTEEAPPPVIPNEPPSIRDADAPRAMIIPFE